MNELVAKCDRLFRLKHSSSRHFVFTEQGVSMLSAVLRCETAVSISILIIDDTMFYHIGASLKDLGKKWFAFSRIDSLAPLVLQKLR